jgi:aryl-alcohol dehydrogenase-like predicted oxidoreductase
MFPGSATAVGTERFADRFPAESSAQFYRRAQGVTVSSLGLGTYLGEMDEETDAAYERAIRRALNGGINFLDTSLNYRHQRSERNLGAALAAWVREDGGSRDEVAVCTKAGYLTPGAIPASGLRDGDVVGGMHCLAPMFLRDQLERSRRNLGLETIDVFYLHNPETQLRYIGEDVFHDRVRAAFEVLEHLAREGAIRSYGLATWEGFRKGSLSLPRLESIAREAGGDGHRFRFVQLPVNLAMTEGQSTLEQARELSIAAVASASLLQARLSRGLPDEVARAVPGTSTDAQRSIQFSRSFPGVTVALVGMSSVAHVEENLGVARIPPLSQDQFARAFA